MKTVQGKGWDLEYKTGYAYGYTLYATKSAGQLMVERDIIMFELINNTNGDTWYIGALDGVEYALTLKLLKEVI
jgi:hypothetical protein